MTSQLGLSLEPQPAEPRASTLRSFHPRLENVAEALAGEARALAQDSRVRSVFELHAREGARLTPSEVHAILGAQEAEGRGPLLTSVRRALTNLTKAGVLVHHKAERRLGPRGARESVWSLA